MSSIRDKLNSVAKNERLFSLDGCLWQPLEAKLQDELYDKEDSMSWNEYFSELVKKLEVMSDEEFALYVERGNVEAAELLLKDIEKFKLIREGIISDYVKLSKSNMEDI